MAEPRTHLPDVSAWPGLELKRPLVGGARNPVFLAEQGSRMFVVRQSGRPPESLQWEIDLLSHLRANNIPVPRLVPTSEDTLHSSGVMVHEFIPGGPPTSIDDWKRIGRILDNLHQLTRNWTQRPGFCGSQELLAVDSGGDINLSNMTEDDVSSIRSAWKALPNSSLCVIHGDLGAGNVLVDGSNVTLIDWDESRVDLPWFDFVDFEDGTIDLPVRPITLARAGLAWETATCWNIEPDYAREILHQFKELDRR